MYIITKLAKLAKLYLSLQILLLSNWLLIVQMNMYIIVHSCTCMSVKAHISKCQLAIKLSVTSSL